MKLHEQVKEYQALVSDLGENLGWLTAYMSSTDALADCMSARVDGEVQYYIHINDILPTLLKMRNSIRDING